MKMQYLFPSISETPSRINPPARFSPSRKNPMLSEPIRTHDDTPPFFSTMKPWIFPLLSSTTISNALDSTVKLHSFLLFRDAELSSPSSPSHSSSHSLSPSLSLLHLSAFLYGKKKKKHMKKCVK
ncbi:hypothetical protein PVL29_019413 [Vitis rotundifolia]|uniref:Uncharacterized protein n=1 Tax=Vitis rotundifolia TaxID=103349 RepID=A0AA38Z0M9_VITRO|nr:hypothetical protein PVL29_019413 [Vitis rotundifolia]